MCKIILDEINICLRTSAQLSLKIHNSRSSILHRNLKTKILPYRRNLAVMASKPPTKQATPEEQKFIDDILKLYQLEPNHQTYSHYRSDAVFHDPVSIAQGLDSIKSQFNGMPKLFAKSTTERAFEIFSQPYGYE